MTSAEPATRVALHPGGDIVLTSSRDGSATLWSLARGKPTHTLSPPGPATRQARFDADGARVLLASEDGSVRVFETQTGRRTHLLKGHDEAVMDAWFRDDAHHLVSAGDDGKCIVWDLARATPARVLIGNPAPIRSAAFHPTESWLAVGGADRWVTVWNLVTGERLHHVLVSQERSADWRLDPFHQVRGLCFDGDSSRLIASLVNNFSLTLDLSRGAAIVDSIENDWFGGRLVFDPATRQVFGSDYSFGRLSSVTNARFEPLTIDGSPPHSNRIAVFEVSPKGGVALSAGHDGRLIVWDLRARTPLLAVNCGSAILDAHFSADARWIITSTTDGSIRLWPVDPLAIATTYLRKRGRSR